MIGTPILQDGVKQGQYKPMDEASIALAAHWAEVLNALVDLLQVLVLALVIASSLLSAAARLIHGFIGLIVWALGAWVVMLKYLQAEVDKLHTGKTTWKL